MTAKVTKKEKRKNDPYLDRRSGEDYRETYDIGYFSEGGPERRKGKERRNKKERRAGCVKVTKWSSVCVKETNKESKSDG